MSLFLKKKKRKKSALLNRKISAKLFQYSQWAIRFRAGKSETWYLHFGINPDKMIAFIWPPPNSMFHFINHLATTEHKGNANHPILKNHSYDVRQFLCNVAWLISQIYYLRLKMWWKRYWLRDQPTCWILSVIVRCLWCRNK